MNNNTTQSDKPERLGNVDLSQVTVAMRLLTQIWGKRKGYVFLPWISGDSRTKDERRRNYHEGPAFHWPRDRDKIKQHIEDHTGDDLYFTPALFLGKQRKEHLLVEEATLWADLDEADPRQGHMADGLRPTIAWETSPGRYQAVWRMDGFKVGASWNGNENHRLSTHIGADPSGWDSTQLLRVPGGANHKPEYGDGVPGRLLWANGPEHTWDQICKRLPELPARVRVTDSDLETVDREQVWARVRGLVSRRVRDFVAAQEYSGDRSGVLWEMERELADAGCSVSEIIAIVQPTVWNKYAGRADEVKRLKIEAGKAALQSETLTEDKEEAFWKSRPFLEALLKFARARRVGPWSLLGSVLARAVASIPPNVVLPATIGSVASLNLFVAMCSQAAGGKTTSMEAAIDFLQVQGGVEFLDTSPGSGEGLMGAYCYTPSKKDDPLQEPVQSRYSVLLQADEVTSLEALANRTNSTLQATMLTAWMGKNLGTLNADVTKRRMVARHSYRLAVICGVQPMNAGAILDERASGYPQRWLWMPTYDPARLSRHEKVDPPAAFAWRVPGPALTLNPEEKATPLPPRVMVLPDIAVDAILEANEETNVPIGSAVNDKLDGHSLLSQAKVAGVLANLDGRGEQITEEDWYLAGQVMAKSNHTRSEIERVRRRAAEVEVERGARTEGFKKHIASETEADQAVLKAIQRVREILRKEGKPLTRNQLSKKGLHRYSNVLEEALDQLLSNGEVIKDTKPNKQNRAVTYLRLAS